MKWIGNLTWMIFGGFFTAIEYIIGGVALCLTIVGIPFGIQSFKLAFFVLMPFGLEAKKRETGSGCLFTIMNIIWFVFGGFWLFFTHLFLGILFCITIIGIPFGKQHFKLMGMCLTPFGRDVVEVD